MIKKTIFSFAAVSMIIISHIISAEPLPFGTIEDDYFGRAAKCNEKEDFAGAIAEMDKAIAENPNNDIAYSLRSTFKKQIGDLNSAFADITKAIEKEPHKLNHYIKRFEINTALSNDAAANADKELILAVFKSDPTLEPKGWNKFHDAAFKFENGKNYAMAIKEMDKAIESAPNFAYAYRSRSYYKDKAKDYEGALTDITTAIGLIENYKIDVFVNYLETKKQTLLSFYEYRMHINSMRLRDIAALMEDCNTVLSMNESAETYATCGFFATQSNDSNLIPLAIKYYDAAIKLDPSGKEGSYYRWRGMNKMNIKDYKGAEFDYSKSLEYHDNDAPAYWSRGEARYYLGDKENALKDLIKSKSLGGKCSIIDELISKINAGE